MAIVPMSSDYDENAKVDVVLEVDEVREEDTVHLVVFATMDQV